MDEELSVRQGEQITIQLPATNRWSVVVRDDGAILQPVEPQGVVDAQGQTVEWRYIAMRQGTKMPHFAMARTYTVTMTA